MVEQRQSAMQRIQVGLIGLIVVLLFVSLANMVLDRVADAPQEAGGASQDGVAGDDMATPDEPLAELGVTPVTNEEEKAKAETAPGTRPAPAPNGR